MPLDGETAFISYSREDSEFALRLARDLKAAGARVWLDQLDIQPGQRWARAVEEAMTAAPRMLVLLSPASVRSTNVEDEIAFALDEHKDVVPILYRDCQVPFRLRNFQYADFRTDFAVGMTSLLRVMNASTAKSSNEETAQISHKLPGPAWQTNRAHDGEPTHPQEKVPLIAEPVARMAEPALPEKTAPPQTPREKDRSRTSKKTNWVVFAVLMVLWLVGFTLHIGGAFVHLLLLLAIVVAIISLYDEMYI